MTKVSTKRPIIVVAKDHVVISGQVVQRPESMAPSQWLDYWERAAKA